MAQPHPANFTLVTLSSSKAAYTVTTVGYGDLSPSTALGKVFTVVYLFVGIGLILGFIDAVSKRTLEMRGERRRQAHHQEDENGGRERDQNPEP